MKKIILFLIVVVLVLSCKEKKILVITPQQNSFTAILNDVSTIFTENERDSLINKIIQFEHKTTNEIAIVTLDSIHGDILIFATDLANKMGVGKKSKDNGLLILIVKPLRKVSIATGYGTEKKLTDAFCQEIINRKMIPYFKKDNYYKGLDAALDEIILKWTN
ncbi:MAG TPA: TPM domain-containing protein [Flavobacteriaceae bacterium]|jgi:uncharacterized protein|nr:TPM domain-containing protein [Flavobacteriaceae bacterium]